MMGRLNPPARKYLGTTWDLRLSGRRRFKSRSSGLWRRIALR